MSRDSIKSPAATLASNLNSSTGQTGKPLTITTLVSVGQHPKSGRARVADQDAKALELALSLSAGKGTAAVGKGEAGAGKSQINLIHAGTATAEQQLVLRGYLGMGVGQMRVLKQSDGADVIPVLVDAVRKSGSDVVLTGSRAEAGEGSGMTPYLVAQSLGWPMVPAAVEITAVGSGEFEILQALPRGQRRLLKVRAPFVASIDAAAAEARQTAWAAGQRGALEHMTLSSNDDAVLAEAAVEPARKRPKRIARAKKAKTAADRFKAATAKSASKGGAVLVKESAEEKAEAIYQMLLSQGVLKAR
ncbi:electron transfer flavoprotein subunit beta [Oceanobacter mangrovi]|uniref:electron transfer flavoprotein subunit beta n=1 Tax=Oceanobacter mangrovi TaxID=2862510 RepID=UPI001C8E1E40|nr:electron transfer flavoprotein subunit beta [Oceanobacter mangrovi]